MRVFNFSPGPAVMPEEVLRKAAAEMLDWHGSGMSVMEMSHRGKEFISIADKAETDLRALLAIPASYKVLFLQGGAVAENAIVPMNLLGSRSVADYVNTGEWSKKSIKEAKKYCTVNIAASAEDKHFTYVPAQETWQLSKDAAYVHVCTNETIGGVEYQWAPDTGDLPVVADMSSHILSRVIDVAKYGVIYGGAQKNMGPAGLTLVIVRDDLDALRIQLERTGGGRFHAQHAADLRHLCRRPGVRMAAGTGRIGGDREEKYRQGGACLRLSRRQRALQYPGAQTGSLAHEHSLPAEGRVTGRCVPQGRQGTRDGAAQGAPFGRRHESFHLQRHAHRRSAGAGRVHEGFRKTTWLTPGTTSLPSTRYPVRACTVFPARATRVARR